MHTWTAHHSAVSEQQRRSGRQQRWQQNRKQMPLDWCNPDNIFYKQHKPKQISVKMTGKSGQPSFAYYIQPASTNAQNTHNFSYRSSPIKIPNTYTTAMATPAAALAFPWTVYQWRNAAQQYYQQACQLKREKEAWKNHYFTLYLAHLEAQKGAHCAESRGKEVVKVHYRKFVFSQGPGSVIDTGRLMP
ncbi:hypothetical protein DOTSEDRAFT_68802 [Dothistroma septosporum NZE10]|uniref:Uncharacterized protein n=1 Tax=Dothistroma septosporum (strain NZE10 / CBS 128990) TaxID=675120 RepID=N1Q576_DOTSN|nr:hypothetical protein DOTSEDRAFT_68802 [Dothistroma septosporum NZE10]